MSRKEREQLSVFQQLKAGKITQAAAAQMLNFSERWINKKFKRYRMQGDIAFVHQNRGKPSPKRWNKKDRKIAIELLKSEWQDFGPTFTAEKLKELKDIIVSNETVRKMMIAEGLWIPKRQKLKHRKWRERKRIRGILVQLDGSPHDWFEGRGPKCTLLVFIDDATSELLWLEFAESESFHGVASATKKYMEKFGRPVSFYTDYGSVFSVNLNNAERDKITQFERIMQELFVDVIHARSPQAKGRVERANQTLQDRLVKEMRLAGISSIGAANAFVQTGNFIASHNAKFAVPPTTEGDAHRSINDYDLDDIFCSQEYRKVNSDFTIHYNRRIIQLEKDQPAIVRPKNHVIICEHLDGEMTIKIRTNKLNFKEVGMRKIGNLSPVENVLMENEELKAKAAANLPVLGVWKTGINYRKIIIENQNFSRC